MASFEKSPMVDQAAIDVVSSSDSKEVAAAKYDGEHPMLQESSTRPKFQDVWAAVLFIANLLVTLGIFVYCVTKASNLRLTALTPEMLSVVFMSAGISLVATMLYMILVFFHPKILIHASFICTTLILIALGIYLCVATRTQTDGTDFIITAVVYFVLAALNLTFYFLWRKRIPFSAALLKATATTIKKYPGVLVLAIAMLFLQLGFIVMWSITMILAFYCNITTHIAWYLIPSLYWNFEFMKNFLHTSVSGVFATYYFQTVSKEEAAKGVVSTAPENPTLFSISRSVTYSFGSIAFGSLVIPFIQLLRSLLCSSNTFVSAIGSCWCGALERLFQCFNEYALAQVAIYGKSFTRAAKVRCFSTMFSLMYPCKQSYSPSCFLFFSFPFSLLLSF